MDTATSKDSQSARLAFKGKIFSVWQWEQELYDGTTGTFERITRPDTAYVLPVLEDKSLLLIDDEQPHRTSVLTIPRGRVDEGETVREAALRELMEETGHAPTELVDWGKSEPAGKIGWDIYFYIARGAYKKADPAVQAGERITLHPVSLEEFVELAAEGTLHDPWLQITMLQAKLDPTKMRRFKELLYGNS